MSSSLKNAQMIEQEVFKTCSKGLGGEEMKNQKYHDHPYDETIMKFFNVRKSQKKNTNFIKFIVKHFCEEFPVALYSDDQDLVDEFN